MNWLREIRARFEQALAPMGEKAVASAALIRPTQDPRFGDFQANMAMPLAKPLGRPPREIAEEIVSRLDIADICEVPEVAGAGFINLRIRDERIATAAAAQAVDDRLGVPPVDSPQTVVIDFSAPNVAKTMHVGHLRSTVIGDSLCRVYRFLGHRVIGDNHIADWGTQFGMILYGYKHFLDRDAFAAEPVAELSRLYRLVNQLSDYHQLAATIPELTARIAAFDEKIGVVEMQTETKADKRNKSAWESSGPSGTT